MLGAAIASEKEGAGMGVVGGEEGGLLGHLQFKSVTRNTHINVIVLV